MFVIKQIDVGTRTFAQIRLSAQALDLGVHSRSRGILMRRHISTAIVLSALALAGCADNRRGEPPARQLGREAHEAANDVERGAKKAAAEAKHAGKEIREGWKEASHDPPPPKR
jgi:hypothetical protein